MALGLRSAAAAPAIIVTALGAAAATGSAARAEMTLSAYGGWQTAPHSSVSGNDPAPGGAGRFDFTPGWDGKSFESPPYYGIRGTWWLDRHPRFGLSVDFTHAKVYGEDLPAGWQTLEFTDGINILTANLLYRWKEEGRAFTPYAGLGAGLSIPHVEVQTGPQAPRTFEYQIGGAAFQAQAGIEYRLTDRISLFTEYKFNYAMNDLDLEGGGSLETDIVTNAINAGLTFRLY